MGHNNNKIGSKSIVEEIKVEESCSVMFSNYHFIQVNMGRAHNKKLFATKITFYEKMPEF